MVASIAIMKEASITAAKMSGRRTVRGANEALMAGSLSRRWWKRAYQGIHIVRRSNAPGSLIYPRRARYRLHDASDRSDGCLLAQQFVQLQTLRHEAPMITNKAQWIQLATSGVEIIGTAIIVVVHLER